MPMVTQSIMQTAQQAAASNVAAAASTGSPANAAASATGTNALQQLGANFNQFLTLLTTQLQNQDPTSPMDTNQFTQELVQFTGVQQSVATNTNLTQLIQLQQGSEVLQSAAVVGHKATFSAGQIALQNGTGQISFNTPAPEQIQLAIVNESGKPVRNVNMASQAGNNSWAWDGRDDSGNKLPDGAYGIALESGTGSSVTSVPFSVVGTATGLVNTARGVQLDIGAVSVGLDKVESLSAQ